MAKTDRLALIKLALLAACADSDGDGNGQAQLRRAAESLSAAAGENLALTLRDILLRRVALETLAAPLARPELKHLAYQVAVCICNADSAHNDLEHAFLERLRVALALDVRGARSFEREADAITGVPLQPDPSRAPLASAHPVDDALVERMIEEYAELTAALAARAEPLPLLATLPLEMKLIYRVGKVYGEEPDRGQIHALLRQIDCDPVAHYVAAGGGLILAGAWDRPRVHDAAAVEQVSRGSYARTRALGRVARTVYGEGRHELAELHERYAAAEAGAHPAYAARAGTIAARARQLMHNDLLTLVKQ